MVLKRRGKGKVITQNLATKCQKNTIKKGIKDKESK